MACLSALIASSVTIKPRLTDTSAPTVLSSLHAMTSSTRRIVAVSHNAGHGLYGHHLSKLLPALNRFWTEIVCASLSKKGEPTALDRAYGSTTKTHHLWVKRTSRRLVKMVARWRIVRPNLRGGNGRLRTQRCDSI